MLHPFDICLQLAEPLLGEDVLSIVLAAHLSQLCFDGLHFDLLAHRIHPRHQAVFFNAIANIRRQLSNLAAGFALDHCQTVGFD